MNENGNTDRIIPTSAQNRLAQLYGNQEFTNLVKQFRAEMEVPNANKLDVYIRMRKAIKEFLISKKIPLSWLEPINIFIRNRKLTFSYVDGIHLRVGSEDISAGDTSGFITIQDSSGRVTSHTEISIVITKKVSMTQIKEFIDKFSEMIEYYQTIIKLPEVDGLNWKKTDQALEIIELKDNKGKTFEEIADLLYEKNNNEYFNAVENIKSLYYRYKKYLELP